VLSPADVMHRGSRYSSLCPLRHHRHRQRSPALCFFFAVPLERRLVINLFHGATCSTIRAHFLIKAKCASYECGVRY
jgi:hypothetical protein